MFFIGATITMSNYTLDSTLNNINNMNYIKIQNGAFDHLYGTKNINEDDFVNIIPDWNYYTFIDANFENNVFGGNVDFSIENTDYIIIKRREKGTYNWIELTKIKIEKESDFSFIYYDNFNSSNTWYEYALVPEKDGIEGKLSIAEVYSEFDGLYIVGNDKIYFGFINLTYPAPIRHKPSTVISPLDNKYPTIINNSKADYYYDTCSATFVGTDENSEWGWDFDNAWRYREEFKTWLLNGKPKMIKYYDGRTWIVGISGDISDKVNTLEPNTVTSFTWYEIGDVNTDLNLLK